MKVALVLAIGFFPMSKLPTLHHSLQRRYIFHYTWGHIVCRRPTYPTCKDVVHRQIEGLLSTSHAMNALIDEYPSKEVTMTPMDYEKFKDMTWTYLKLYSALAKHFMTRGLLLFDLTVKSHYLAHVMLQARWLNPRLSWTFAGEDLMHTMKILAQSCVKGTKSPNVASKMLAKYRVTLQLRFQRMLWEKVEPTMPGLLCGHAVWTCLFRCTSLLCWIWSCDSHLDM